MLDTVWAAVGSAGCMAMHIGQWSGPLWLPGAWKWQASTEEAIKTRPTHKMANHCDQCETLLDLIAEMSLENCILPD